MKVKETLGQDEIRHPSHQQNHAVHGNGPRLEMILVHPCGGEGNDGEPEQQVQVRPERHAAYALRSVEKMMMVVPIDRDVNEAERVTQEKWHHWTQCLDACPMGRLHFQHHDGDDYSQNSVTERLEAALIHTGP